MAGSLKKKLYKSSAQNFHKEERRVSSQSSSHGLVKIKKKKKTVPRPATVEDDTFESAEECEIIAEPDIFRHSTANKKKSMNRPQSHAGVDHEQTIMGRHKRSNHSDNDANTINAKKIYNSIEAAAANLALLGDREAITKWLQENGFEDSEMLKDFESLCASIANRIRSPAVPSKSSARSFENLEQFYFYRNGSNSIMLLAPVEVFTGTRSLQNKTIGFVRNQGDYFALQGAFSGWEDATHFHELLLDNYNWSHRVLDYCKVYNFMIRGDGWDSHHKQPSGLCYASHVEVKLMLWYALSRLEKLTGRDPEIKNLVKLRKLKHQIKADVILSEHRCGECWRFKEHIEKITGIAFTLKTHPNLGVIKKAKDVNGSRKYPTHIGDSDDDEDELVGGPPECPKHTTISFFKSHQTAFVKETRLHQSESRTPKRRKYSETNSDSDDYQPNTPTKKKKDKNYVSTSAMRHTAPTSPQKSQPMVVIRSPQKRSLWSRFALEK